MPSIPLRKAHVRAASRHVAAEHHRHQAAHERNQGNRDEAKEQVAAADNHSKEARKLTAEAAKHSQRTG